MISVDDIGAFAAMAFERPGHWEGKAIELAGDELSMTDIAEVLGRTIGREVTYRQAPWEEFEKLVGPELTTMYQWFQSTGYRADIPALRTEHWKLASFDNWARVNWERRMTA
jgi:uncharacterized protein YbjT (DUF2867 family)